MADPILNISPEIQAAPAGAGSSAQPISMDDLQRELGQSAGSNSNNNIFSNEQVIEDHSHTGDDGVSLSFEDAAKKLVAEKASGEQTEEEKPVKRERKQKEVVTEDVKEKPVKSTETAKESMPEEVPEHELAVLPTDKPSTKRRIEAFLSKEKKLREESDVLRKELEEAKKQPATQVNLEEVERIKQEKAAADAELTKYRRLHDINNDPEFKSKFDEPITQAETTIKETLKKYNFSEPTLKAIEAEGGFAAFSRSNKTFQVPQIVDGVQQDVTMTASQLAKHWLDNLQVADQEDIRRSIGEQQSLERQKKSTIEKEVAGAREYFTKRDEEMRKSQEAAVSTQRQMTETFEKLVNEAESSVNWLKDKELPANATADQKKEVEDYNKFQKELRGILRKHPTKPEEYFEIIRGAAEAHYLRREEGSLRKELEAARSEIAKLKGNMKTTTKSGSLMTAPKPQPKEKVALSDDWMSGLEADAKRKMSGEDFED